MEWRGRQRFAAAFFFSLETDALCGARPGDCVTHMQSALHAKALAIFVAIGCIASRSSAADPTIVPFDNNTELISSITGSASPTVLFSQPITFGNGDILQTVTEFEVTNDTNSTVHIWAEIVLSSTSGGTTGNVIGEANEKSPRSTSMTAAITANN